MLWQDAVKASSLHARRPSITSLKDLEMSPQRLFALRLCPGHSQMTSTGTSSDMDPATALSTCRR
jgi:hypothetical protein